MNVTEHPIYIDPEHHTIRPHTVDDEDYYGVASGSNGTAAECHRRLVESVISRIAPVPWRWIWCRASGVVATAVTLLGSGEEPGEIDCVTLDRKTWGR